VLFRSLDDRENQKYYPMNTLDLNTLELSEDDMLKVRARINSEDIVRRTEVEFIPGAFLSLFFMTNFQNLTYFPSARAIVYDGWARNNFTTEIVEIYGVVRRYLKETRYKAKDYLDMTFAMVPDSNKMKSTIKEC